MILRKRPYTAPSIFFYNLFQSLGNLTVRQPSMRQNSNTISRMCPRRGRRRAGTTHFVPANKISQIQAGALKFSFTKIIFRPAKKIFC